MKTHEELLTLLKEIYVCVIQEETLPESLLTQIEEAIQEE